MAFVPSAKLHAIDVFDARELGWKYLGELVGDALAHLDSQFEDPNWAELMKSMQTMHAAMGAAKPSGDDDTDFVNLMQQHHKAAVDRAKAELLHGSYPQMRRLAQEIIADQESEIQLLQLWLGRQRTQSKEPQSTGSQKEQ